MNEKLLQRYVGLVIREGVNARPGQFGLVRGSLEDREVVEAMAEGLSRLGCTVEIHWADHERDLERLHEEPASSLETPPEDLRRVADRVVDEEGVLISVTDRPQFPGVDPALVAALERGREAAAARLREAVLAVAVQRCTIGAPNPGLARIAFPDRSDTEAISAYEAMIADVCFLNEPDPARALRDQDRQLAEHAERIMKRRFTALRIQGPSTDLLLPMNPDAVWLSSYKHTTKGVLVCPNIPGGEIFSYPDARGGEGQWRAAAPLFLNGLLVEDASLELQGGEVVAWSARTGDQTAALKEFFTADDEHPNSLYRRGTRRLGEVALVDRTQPMTRYTHVVTPDILYVEKRLPHAAFGLPYAACHPRGNLVSREEQRALGLNHSTKHLDLMLPWDHIEGRDEQGRWHEVMVGGEFKI